MTAADQVAVAGTVASALMGLLTWLLMRAAGQPPQQQDRETERRQRRDAHIAAMERELGLIYEETP